MKLLSLRLKNFKGTKDFTLEAGGQNVSVFGDNATGKTTLFDACCWLLFDKDSRGKKDFDIKTLDSAGNVIHGLDHEVEGTFSVNGKAVTLRKVYAEKWTKKRGSVSAEFTGHETSYYINDVPVKKSEFVSRVSEIADEEVFKLLTSPSYFNEQLHWQKRRETIMEVCGDVSVEEVIATDNALAKLPEILGDRDMSEHKKMVTERRSKLNWEIEKIPIRIDEVMLGLPDISGINEDDLTQRIGFKKSRLQTKKEELLQIQAGGEIVQKKSELTAVTTELMNLQNEHREFLGTKISEKRNTADELTSTARSLQRQAADLTTDTITWERKIQNLKIKQDSLRDQWHMENKKEFEIHQETVCPACGQDLPADKLEEARKNALAAFNEEKAKKLEVISTDGKQIKEEIAGLELKVTEATAQTQNLQAQAKEAENEAANIRTEIANIENDNTLEKFTGYAEKLQQKIAIEKELANLREGNSGVVSAVVEEINQIERDIEALEADKAKITQREAGLKRIDELKAQEKQLAAEFEKLEGELYLIEQFIRAKVFLLEEKINGKFEMARFKLFDVQVNGGIAECCETLYNGVPYGSGLNNAARINVGLDIINTLSQHYGFTAPIFIDNRESVTELIDVDAQVISLIVSGIDKKLRVEKEEKLSKEVA